jgi:hypothetical protein
MPSPHPSSRALPLVPDVDVAILFLFAPTGRPVLACHLQSLRSSVRTEMVVRMRLMRRIHALAKAWWFGRGWDHTHPCTTLNTPFAPSLLRLLGPGPGFLETPFSSRPPCRRVRQPPLSESLPCYQAVRAVPNLRRRHPSITTIRGFKQTHLPIHCPQSQRGLHCGMHFL